MKMILVLFLVGILSKVSFGEDCYPDLFNRKGWSGVETISVSRLSTEPFLNVDQKYEIFGGSYNCHVSAISIKAEDIKQSRNFKIIGLDGFQYRHSCIVNGKNYRYIGSKFGVMQLSEKLAVLNPHFFVVQPNDFSSTKWSVIVFAKFHPCSGEQVDGINTKIEITDDDKTIIEVKNLPSFNPAWPHYYLSDHGEPMTSIHVFDLEKYMHFSPTSKMTATLAGADFVFTVEDDKLHLKTSPDSASALLALGRFSIKDKEYSKEVTLTHRTQEDKRNFVRTFFPSTTIPFTEIPADNFVNNILSNISSIGALTMKSTHGIPRDAKTRYHFEAIGKLHQNIKSKYLKDMTFGIRISGDHLQNIHIHFGFSENKCRFQHDHILDFISTEMKRLAQTMPGEAEAFYSHQSNSIDNNFVCRDEGFLVNSIDLTYVDGANDRSVFKTTIKWEQHDGLFSIYRHVTQALLRIEDFVKILFN